MNDEDQNNQEVEPTKAQKMTEAETSDGESPTESTTEESTPVAETTVTPSVEIQRSKFAGVKWLGKSLVHAAILAAVFVGGIALIGVAQRIGWIQAGGQMVAEATDDHDHDGETIYTCPMHPQIRQNEPGNCPICAMKLVPIADKSKSTAKKEPATEEGDDRYICPMMCTPPSSEPGRCPVCAMELVEATGGNDSDGLSVMIEPAARPPTFFTSAIRDFNC